MIFVAGGTNLVRADGSPNITMTINIVGAVVNTVLDAIFVLGFKWGMAGAAAATIIGQYVSALMVIIYFTKWKSAELSIRHFAPHLKYIGRVTSLGLAPCFNQLALMVTQVVLNKSLNHYGALSPYGKDIPIAVCGIVIKCFQVTFAFIIGLSQGLQPIVSFNYGAKKYDRVKRAYFSSIKVGLVISVISWLIFMIFPHHIISLFGNGSDLYFEYGTKFCRVFLFGCILGFLWVLLGFLRWANWVIPCILPVYLGVSLFSLSINPYYLSKKKMIP